MAGLPGCDRSGGPGAGRVFSISSARWLPKIPLDYLKHHKGQKAHAVGCHLLPLFRRLSRSPCPAQRADGARCLPALPGDGGLRSRSWAGDEERRCRQPGPPEARLRGGSRASGRRPRPPARGRVRVRAGGYCPRREDGGGRRGALSAAGCAVSAGGDGRGRSAGPAAGSGAGSAGGGGWARVLGGGVWEPPPRAAAGDDPGGEEEEEAWGDRLSE